MTAYKINTEGQKARANGDNGRLNKNVSRGCNVAAGRDSRITGQIDGPSERDKELSISLANPCRQLDDDGVLALHGI